MGILSWLSLDARRGVKGSANNTKTTSRPQKTKAVGPSSRLDSESESEFELETESEEVSSGEEYSAGTPDTPDTSNSPSLLNSSSDSGAVSDDSGLRQRRVSTMYRRKSGAIHRDVTKQKAPKQLKQSKQPKQPKLKRVRSSWRIRPLMVEEKLKVFVQGRDDEELFHYDGGDFYEWLKDCENGKADPALGFPYPLLVQDADLRTILEIKGPLVKEKVLVGANIPKMVKKSTINVPSWQRVLENSIGGKKETTTSKPASSSNKTLSHLDLDPVTATKKSLEDSLTRDPPYIRYVQPTPEELEVSIEYDLDEEDEEWLNGMKGTKASRKKLKSKLDDELLERLIDRFEKGFSSALQRRPDLWDVVVKGEMTVEERIDAVYPCPDEEEVVIVGGGGGGDENTPGVSREILRTVYAYWKNKHARSRRPLIPRLWYEPQWKASFAYTFTQSPISMTSSPTSTSTRGPHRKKKKVEHEEKKKRKRKREDQFSLFAALDAPPALAGIRKRRLEPDEVKVRFDAIRRDLEGARTLADLVRRREKLKRKEVQMWREEWAVKMAEISLTNHSMTTLRKLKGRTKPSFKSVDPPAMPYALSNTRGKRAVSERVAVDGVRKGEMLETDRGNRPSRARRLAARRQSQAEQLFDAFGGNETSSTTTTTRRRRRRRGGSLVGEAAKLERSTYKKKKVLSSTRNSTKRGTRTKTKTKDNVDLIDQKSHRYLRRGPPPPPGVDRNPNCEWCGASSGATVVGCSTCHRCFCFKCFQRRPGCGINNWSRAIKDLEYVCQYCKEARPRPSPLVLGPHQQEKDKKKSVLLKKPGSSVVLPSNVGKRSPQPRGPTGRFLSFQKENRKPPPLLESKNDTADSKARASDFVITKRRGRAN